MLQTFIAIIPAFALMGAGYVVRRSGLAPQNWIEVLNRFVYIVALPALIITNLLRIDFGTTGVYTALAVSLALPIITGFALLLILPLTKLPRASQAAVFLLCVLGNTIFLGIPIATAMQPSASPALITTLGTAQFLAGLFIGLIGLELRFSQKRHVGNIITTLLKNPLVISLAIGAVLALTPGINSVTTQLESILKLLAATASPLALFALGMFWVGHTWRPSYAVPVMSIAAIKLVAMPALLISMSAPLQLATSLGTTTIIMAAMPPAVTAFVLAKTYKIDTNLVATSLVATTLMSALSLPIIGSLIGL
jgi:hypothetical protein